jgi:hypothetical protein
MIFSDTNLLLRWSDGVAPSHLESLAKGGQARKEFLFKGGQQNFF